MLIVSKSNSKERLFIKKGRWKFRETIAHLKFVFSVCTPRCVLHWWRSLTVNSIFFSLDSSMHIEIKSIWCNAQSLCMCAFVDFVHSLTQLIRHGECLSRDLLWMKIFAFTNCVWLILMEHLLFYFMVGCHSCPHD